MVSCKSSHLQAPHKGFQRQHFRVKGAQQPPHSSPSPGSVHVGAERSTFPAVYRNPTRLLYWLLKVQEATPFKAAREKLPPPPPLLLSSAWVTLCATVSVTRWRACDAHSERQYLSFCNMPCKITSKPQQQQQQNIGTDIRGHQIRKRASGRGDSTT